VIEWLPASRLDVEKVAVPPFSVPVPSVVDPSLKVTLPVGAPAPGVLTLTFAVNVTLWPYTDGLIEADKFVVVAAGFTVWLKAPEPLAESFVSPP
jgi:hypothetical protein